MYARLIKAVQQRSPLPYTFKLIDECLQNDSKEDFLSKYISVSRACRLFNQFCIQALEGKRFQADSHAKVIAYLERKGFSFTKHDPFWSLECDGEYSGDLHQHRFFELGEGVPIIHLASSGNMVSSGTTGFFLWEGSVAFLACLMENETFRQRFFRKRVLELGSGSGLAGISVATVAEPARVELTDVERVCEAFTQPNVENNPRPSLASSPLDWTDHDRLSELKQEFDLFIGCDLVYDPDVCQLLLEACRQLLADSQVREILLLCTLRNPQTFETFVSEARDFASVTLSTVSISPSNPVLVTDSSSLRLIEMKPKTRK